MVDEELKERYNQSVVELKGSFLKEIVCLVGFTKR